MPRAKGSPYRRRRRKKVLKQTKGHWGTRHRLYRRAHESMLKSLSHAYRHRRERKRDMRQLWISRINAASRSCGLSYGQFVNRLKKAGVEINRKMLAELAINDPAAFSKLVELAKQQAN